MTKPRTSLARSALILAGALLLTGLLVHVEPFERFEAWIGDVQQNLAAPVATFERTLVVDI
ncbi:MAG: hypothetical protein ABI478_09685, partial [Propionivibrio sp.]